MGGIKNIPLRIFRAFLTSQGLTQRKAKGGHEKWIRADLGRPIILQAHIDPVPQFIILTNLRTLGVSKKEFLEYIASIN